MNGQLYFVAYTDCIYIYRPRNVPHQRLAKIPDYILKPPTSRQGAPIHGVMDPMNGHQVNHLVVGDFGEDEVLLLAYDDGDVIAYFTRQFVTLISRRRHPRSYLDHRDGEEGLAAWSIPRPFLRENVGKSAWGLALHKAERLIAVGSNKHQVTVFAPALAEPLRGLDDGDSSGHMDWQGNRDHRTDRSVGWADMPLRESASPDDRCSSRVTIQQLRRTRSDNFRITLDGVGAEIDNIPSLAFVDDERGNAELVVALDINGHLWVWDIWTGGSFPPHKIPNYRGSKTRT